MTYVRKDEKEADAVKSILNRVAVYAFGIDLLLADRGFYNERAIRGAREVAATVVPAHNKGYTIEKKLDRYCSYMTT